MIVANKREDKKRHNTNKLKASRRVVIKDNPNAFRVVSYFAGCGGLDLGFMGGFTYRGSRVKNQPFRVVAAYDVDKRAAATYALNIGKHMNVADLIKLPVEQIPAADLLIGGFPCQEFSRCGPRQGLNSERGKLYAAMVAYARTHKPAVVVVENVPDLITINGGWDFRVIRSQFTRAGYRHYVWDIPAADYGVPQLRHRVFVIFVRKDVRGDPVKPRSAFKGRHRSVEWAIGDLRGVRGGSIPNQDQYFKANLAKTGHGQGDERNPRKRPGYTVRANAKSRVQFHYALKRRLTIRECARLQTFPDWFVFPHHATTNMFHVGNAVPPLLANKVAGAVAKYLVETGVEPRARSERVAQISKKLRRA